MHDVAGKAAVPTELLEGKEFEIRIEPPDESEPVVAKDVHGNAAIPVNLFVQSEVKPPLPSEGPKPKDDTESADPALFEKRTICWHPHASERPPFRRVYQELIQLRKQNPAFRTPSVQWLHNSCETSLVTYLRADEKDSFLVAINFANRPVDGQVDLPDGAGFAPVRIAGLQNSAAHPLPSIHLSGFGWQIFHRTIKAVAAK